MAIQSLNIWISETAKRIKQGDSDVWSPSLRLYDPVKRAVPGKVDGYTAKKAAIIQEKGFFVCFG